MPAEASASAALRFVLMHRHGGRSTRWTKMGSEGREKSLPPSRAAQNGMSSSMSSALMAAVGAAAVSTAAGSLLPGRS